MFSCQCPTLTHMTVLNYIILFSQIIINVNVSGVRVCVLITYRSTLIKCKREKVHCDFMASYFHNLFSAIFLDSFLFLMFQLLL
jgi:hypothetical protein